MVGAPAGARNHRALRRISIWNPTSRRLHAPTRRLAAVRPVLCTADGERGRHRLPRRDLSPAGRKGDRHRTVRRHAPALAPGERNHRRTHRGCAPRMDQHARLDRPSRRPSHRIRRLRAGHDLLRRNRRQAHRVRRRRHALPGRRRAIWQDGSCCRRAMHACRSWCWCMAPSTIRRASDTRCSACFRPQGSAPSSTTSAAPATRAAPTRRTT